MGFLIPANSKKSLLYFGIFNTFDLILFGSGLAVTTLLLLILPVAEVAVAVIALLPALITGFLILPVPNYHNMLTILRSMIEFYTSRQRYVWKGWCYYDVKKATKK